MKPKKKTIYVKAEYWDCGHPDHRHKTEKVAQECITKGGNVQKKSLHDQLAINRERWIVATVMMIYGHTAKEAGDQIGVSEGRARQIVKRIISRASRYIDWTKMPECSREIRYVRKSKDAWTNALDKLRDQWEIEAEGLVKKDGL
jgi:hypothetical protein